MICAMYLSGDEFCGATALRLYWEDFCCWPKDYQAVSGMGEASKLTSGTSSCRVHSLSHQDTHTVRMCVCVCVCVCGGIHSWNHATAFILPF